KYLSRLNVEKINQFSWEFIDGATYRGTVCSKAGILLQSLRNHLGEKRIMDFFRFYADKFKFRHPTTSDFIKTFNHFMGEDLSWVFEQFVNGNINLDHSVYTVKSTRINRHPEKYRNEIIFLRKEGYFPVELLIKLKDGKEIKYYWKERENWKKIILENDSPLEYAAIDPKFKILLDKNIFNNSKAGKISSDAITKIAVKFGFYFQNLLSFLFL
ncbi:MAG: hypothetical protein KAT17_05445, partial [Candidatus Aminicenantes bacterium]|nr:hypothetical protein [Candidatus Aminicenantes bacterium]